MLKKSATSKVRADLRRRAEASLKKGPVRSSPPLAEADSQRILHELQVHQIELEMQNAELSRASAEATASADKFAELYEKIRLLNADLESRVEQRTAEIAALLEQSRRMQEQLRRLSHLILRAQEEERKRISHEVHDQIAQSMICVNLELIALARQNALKPGSFRRGIARAQRLVADSVDALHQLTRKLRPPGLDDLGLIPVLHAYMKDLTRQTGVRIRFRTFAGVEQLDHANRTVLYRVVQAALTNVAQHAKASRAEVRIQRGPAGVRLEVQDNGKGFQVDRDWVTSQSKHLGLLGMKERLEMIGGRFSFESAPRRGTIIRAEIPIGRAEEAGRLKRDS